MKVMVEYKGGVDKEVIECIAYYAHSSGGFAFKTDDEMDVFISSADVRKIYKIKEPTC
jgi:hypothetical protein